MSTTTPARAASAASAPVRQRKRRVDPMFYVFLIPTLVLFSLSITLPALLGIFYSFTNSIGFGEWDFIGVRNYISAFRDPSVLSAYGFTIMFALVTTIVVNVLAFLIALGLTANIRFRTALRAIYVIPMVISGIIIAFVFQFLFSNSVPAFGAWIGSDVLSESLLANPTWAWVTIVIVTAWQSIPGTMLIYIAGILSIPGEVYEASSIDGANPTQQLFRITLPLVAGYVLINTIISFKNFLNTYDIIVGLTDGGPGTATRSVAMTIFRGFEGGDYAYQMANATIFFVIAIVLALLQLRLSGGKSGLAS
ncbi:sugar ABC transporter permease [Brachybacterium sp. JHP9]|uniref:Sugar ABC transporter permease n=1 Tax=Brachybacterium equifaecis TaxID=2910770 RepID=A0ABT0QX53_9MICO|nr:sugar ABC transporter permease [Brachybacterium equifaecis]MCL6422234.1 sugar ABC transporter permease [Brachybacterium equifaecis]